jgi:hypothetical protein
MTTLDEIEGGSIEVITDKDYRINQYDFSATRNQHLTEIATAEQERAINETERRVLAR